MSISSRLNGLTKRLPQARRPIVVIKPTVKEDEAGRIDPSGSGLMLTVPFEHGHDPMAGLSPAQRAAIPPTADLVVVRYAHAWRETDATGPRRREWDDLRAERDETSESTS